MSPVLDLDRRHFTRVKGDLTLIGTWIKTEDHDWRACLVIIRTGEEFSEHNVPCVVTADLCYIWADIPGVGDPRRAARMAMRFATALRMADDPKNLLRIAILINDHLDDLLHIPPWAPRDTVAVAEMEVTDNNTGKTSEIEVKQDV